MTTMPTVDPKQTITWKDGTTDYRFVYSFFVLSCFVYFSKMCFPCNSSVVNYVQKIRFGPSFNQWSCPTIVSDWQVSIGMTLYISSTTQHFPYSTLLPTQLNYGGFITTKRGARSLVINGYQYTLAQPKRQRGAVLLEIYWQTVQGKSCYQWRSVSNLHYHEPNHVEVAVNKVVQEMKTKARSETFDSKDLCTEFKHCGWWWSSCHLAYLELYKDIRATNRDTLLCQNL